MKPGARNLITDIAGLYVGNASDAALKSGTTVLVGDRPFVASVDIMGGAPGTRETDLLAPDKLVQQVDALVLSGGSAFGLDAASGVVDGLHEKGRGFAIGDVRIPIVPAAILNDMLNGGDKNWANNPYPALGRAAFHNAAQTFELGSVGAGTGATTANLKGGLGSASVVLENGITVGALVAVNPFGAVTPGNQPHFWAAPWEVGNEFGGRGVIQAPDPFENPAEKTMDGLSAIMNTTIAIVATDARLDKSQAKRMAVAAQDGMARSIVPSHTAVDGDLLFAVSTGATELSDPLVDQLRIGHAAATCLSRAIARAVFLAVSAESDLLPTWGDLWE